MVSEEHFQKMLRLNLLETFKPSAAVKNIKKFNVVDIEAKIKPLYMFAKRKATISEIMRAVHELEKNGYLEKTRIEDMDYWSMSDKGKDTLQLISEGEDLDLL